MTVAVAIAMAGTGEGLASSRVEADPRLTLVRRCADLTEALAVAHSGLVNVVVVSDQPHLNRAIVAELRSVGVAVVGVPASPGDSQDLHGIGIDEVVQIDAVEEALADRIATVAQVVAATPLIAEEALPAADGDGVIVAVWGPTGAPGRTTLAVNIAAECAQAGHESLVVDVDTYGGAVAQTLGLLDEAPGIAALARASLHGVLTDHVIWRHAVTAGKRLKVLSGMSRASRWPELSRSALDDIWPTLRRHAQVTVIDCGFSLEQDEDIVYDTRAPQRNGATLSALAAADVIVVVGTSEPVGIQRLVQALTELTESTVASGSRIVVANRVRSSVAGRHPQEAIADALARYSGVDRVWIVPFDDRACDAATLAGQTLSERAPRSPARSAIGAIAGAVLDEAKRRHPGSGLTRASARASAVGLGD